MQRVNKFLVSIPMRDKLLETKFLIRSFGNELMKATRISMF